jgi:hypothetical protein
VLAFAFELGGEFAEQSQGNKKKKFKIRTLDINSQEKQPLTRLRQNIALALFKLSSQ